MCCGSVLFVRSILVEVEVPVHLGVGDDAADGVDDEDVQISEDTLGFTPLWVG